MRHTPHYLLFVQAGFENSNSRPRGFWQFSIEPLSDEARMEVKDFEDQRSIERLELLGLVRGLEALEQPSQVMLVSTSSHLNRGLRKGLPIWRDSGWEWERFGAMAPVRDRDLWQRVDHAMRYHKVQSRFLRADDPAESIIPSPHFLSKPATYSSPQLDRISPHPLHAARKPGWIERMRAAASDRQKSRRPFAIGA